MLLCNLTQELGAQELSVHHLPAYTKLQKTTAIKETSSIVAAIQWYLKQPGCFTTMGHTQQLASNIGTFTKIQT